MTVFRVHLSNGSKIDVPASTSTQAAGVAAARHPGCIVTKVKVVRAA